MKNRKIEELLKVMTLEEKVAQMVQVSYAHLGREKALEWAKRGAGSFLHVLGDDAREVQKVALESGHGIPVIFGIDAIHGHGLNDHATIFPTQLAMACSWNKELIKQVGRITAKEVAADGLHWTFSPVLCLARDTRWGRIDETFGEDAYLTGELGAAIIEGYQGESIDSPDSILACAKHYIGYGEAIGARDSYDTEMTYRKLKDVFLPPFKKAVDAKCATIMTAYGSIDGEPFTASKKALKDILRDELGFQGFVVTDWDNVNSLVNKQYVAADIKEASKLAAEAGNDMIMSSLEFYEAAIHMVKEGKLDEAVIDEAVRNILNIKFEMGLFEHPEKEMDSACIGCAEHLAFNKEMTNECVVLLKNEDVLPIKSSINKIAVIGPNADDIKTQYGDWAYFTHPLPNPDRQPVRPYTTVIEGIREAAGEDVEVSYIKGCSVLENENDDVMAAKAVAQENDLIVFVIGDEIDQAGEIKDRANLELSGKQLELFRLLKETGKPIVTVLVSFKPLCVEEVVEGSDAFMVAFNGGMFGGNAVAQILFGNVNPSGKLPISFPRHTGQIPVYYNYLPGWHGGKYMDLPETPLFTFGQGLSYTTFEYGAMKVDEANLTISVDVTNIGARDGAEIVQLYFNDKVSSMMTPVKQLVRFAKVFIPVGTTKTVTFTLTSEDFSFVNYEEKRVTEHGEIELMIGASSADQDLQKVTINI
ncbi:glycoside hydrolase family 3 N-terminal domain-containing protein [Cellulosilyticum ruminicola]